MFVRMGAFILGLLASGAVLAQDNAGDSVRGEMLYESTGCY